MSIKCSASHFTILLLTISVASLCVNALNLSLKDYEALLATSSQIWGPVKKSGALPVEYWSLFHFNKNSKSVFKKSYKDPKGRYDTPLLSSNCWIFVNHGYKLIYVKNPKSASHSILYTVSPKCKDNRVGIEKSCWIEATSQDAFTDAGISPSKAWETYTVITVSRNPWSRASSGFNYLSNRGNKRCFTSVSYPEFCEDPLLLGRVCDVDRSCCKRDPNWFTKHVEPLHRCMKLKDGELVVDYILRYEHLAEDWQRFAQVINARPNMPQANTSILLLNEGKHLVSGGVSELYRSSSGATTEGDDGQVQQQSSDAERQELKPAAVNKTEVVKSVESSARYAEDLMKCGPPCVKSLAEFYSEDLKLFGFSVPKPFTQMQAKHLRVT